MRFRTKDQIQRHLSAQKTSGMTVAAYCRQEDIAQNTFFKWRQRFPSRQNTTQAVSFLKLPIAPPVGDRLDLTLPNGTRISTPLSFDSSILRDVVRLLAPLRPRR